MKKIKMTIELLADTLSGSGEGFGAIIDTDVQYDGSGIPYISSKRVKGALRNSLHDILEMPAFKRNQKINKQTILDSVFGKKGSAQSTSLEMSDFFIEDYNTSKKWFDFLKEKYPSIISSEKILSTFTNIRMQTKVDKKGIAEKHSLRTSRVVNKGLKLHAEITIDENNVDCVQYLPLACANLRRIGTKRNRGLGEVKCELIGISLSDSLENMKNTLEGK